MSCAWCGTGFPFGLGCHQVDRTVGIVRGDVRNQKALERALGEYEIATVFHLAAQTTVGVANRNPVSTLDTNIRALGAAEACRRSPTVQQIIIASSDKAYGDQDDLRTRRMRHSWAGIPTTSASRARTCWRKCTRRVIACRYVSLAAAISMAAAISTGIVSFPGRFVRWYATSGL